MSWDRIRRDWQRLRDRVAEEWEELTDDQIDECEGDRDILIWKLQEAYDIDKQAAEQQVSRFERDLCGETDVTGK